ncbi:MAG TPA: sugar phosphate isomerase/epimerase family protein [Chloroflexota bacterium]|jgi:sugar phosphate isomerase/epimerase
MAFKLAFSTLGCPGWTIEQAGDAARRHGYAGVEIRLLDGEIIPADLDASGRARVKRALAGLGIPSVGTSCRFTSLDPAERAASRAAAERYLGLAADLGAETIRVFGGNVAPGDTLDLAVGRIAESLNELALAAERAGVRIALETHDAMSAGRTVADALAAVPSPWVGALWDSHHPYRMGETAEQTYRLLEGRILSTHVKDARRQGEGWQLLPMGEGEVPVREMLAALHGHGWSGWVSVEWEKKWHPELADPEVAFPQHVEVLSRYFREIGA